MPVVLVTDDEPLVCGPIKRALSSRGYPTESATTAAECLHKLDTNDVELVVLDLLMPDVKGTALLETIRKRHPHVKVFVLSGIADVNDKVRCLTLGAVDYVTKPFSIAELVARIDLRTANDETRSPSADAEHELTYRIAEVGFISLDTIAQTVTVRGRVISLSQREFQTLARIAERDGDPVRREDLLSQVWGFNFDPGSNLVDVCVRRLRNKLGVAVIETVRNVGYRLQVA